jgi:hypothetical protein
MAYDVDVPGNKVCCEKVLSPAILSLTFGVMVGLGPEPALGCEVDRQRTLPMSFSLETHQRLGPRWYPRHHQWACLLRLRRKVGLLRLSRSH